MTTNATGDAAFAAKLYRAMPAAPGNRLVSPLSIRIAFAMAWAGAKGETAEEMRAALALGDASTATSNLSAVLADFDARGKQPDTSKMKHDYEKEGALRRVTTLRVVNRLWGQTGRAFTPAYTKTLDGDFHAPLEQLDFMKDPEAARLRINGWVEEKTEQKIKNLLGPRSVPSDMRLMLTNAVYFKASWDDPFVEQNTEPKDFFVNGTTKTTVAMMQSGGHRKYIETPNATVMSLPYADGHTAMYFVLPKDKAGLAAVESSFSGSDVTAWTTASGSEMVRYSIPKFKFEGGLAPLIDAMKSLGIKRAFKFPDADFSGMDGSRELFIGTAVHKTYIALDEKGTEAAAATALGMRAGGGPPRNPKTFVADHPFMFFIYDDKTASVLFVGRVVDPTH